MPIGGGDVIQLKFYDEDGAGALDPSITPVLAQLTAGKTYAAVLTLKNESVVPADDITLEIEEEKNDHQPGLPGTLEVREPLRSPLGINRERKMEAARELVTRILR